MKIKRKTKNIVKPCAVSKTPSSQNKKLGYGKYRLPNIDDVPADYYYSIIMHIEDTVTSRTNKKAIAVYYDIAKFSDVYKKANKLFKDGEKLNVLHIKQIYPLDSDAYILFLEAMHKALNIDHEHDISWDDCIGISEWISLGYTSTYGIGGIQERTLWDDEDFIYMYEEEHATVTSSNDSIDWEYDEYGNVI